MILNFPSPQSAPGLVLAFIGLLWFGAISLQADRYVVEPGTPGGTDTGEFNDWTIAATQIQWAVDKAANDETVWVSNGVYLLTNQISVTKGIVLRSTNGMDHTFVNGGGYLSGSITNRCFYLGHSNAMLDGFTITNGNAGAQSGGGIYMTNGIVQNCLIAMNVSSNGGGGVYISSGGGTVRDCVISNNNGSVYGGGIRTAAGLIQRCTIVTNRARLGGGMNISASTTDSCTVTGNVCTEISFGGGGGIYLGNSCLVQDCTIVNNLVPNGSFPGGGFYFVGANSIVQDCTISGNRGPANGGGAYFHPQATNCVLRTCTIASNTGVSGAGVLLESTNLSTVERCIISYNIASGGGGGVGLLRAGGKVRNCLISSNSASSGGGGAYFFSSGTGLLENCTVVSNSTASQGGGVFCTNNAGGNITNCIIYFNQAARGGDNYTNNTGILNLTYSCTTPLPEGNGNTANNPLFVNAGNANYRLRPDSPCINAGLNGSWMTNAFDRDGRARIRYGTVDMGTYEIIQDGTIYGFH